MGNKKEARVRNENRLFAFAFSFHTRIIEGAEFSYYYIVASKNKKRGI